MFTSIKNDLTPPGEPLSCSRVNNQPCAEPRGLSKLALLYLSMALFYEQPWMAVLLPLQSAKDNLLFRSTAHNYGQERSHYYYHITLSIKDRPNRASVPDFRKTGGSKATGPQTM